MINPMSKISVLCEKGDRKGLIDLISNYSDIIFGLIPGKTEEEIADGFIQAHQNMRLRRNQEEYEQLNKMHDLMQKGENNGKA